MERKFKYFALLALMLFTTVIFGENIIVDKTVEDPAVDGIQISFQVTGLPILSDLDEPIPGTAPAWVIFWDFGDGNFFRETVGLGELTGDLASGFSTPAITHTYFQVQESDYVVSASATPIYSKVDEPELIVVIVDDIPPFPNPTATSLFSPENTKDVEVYFDWPAIREGDKIQIAIEFREQEVPNPPVAGFVYFYAPVGVFNPVGTGAPLVRLSNQLDTDQDIWLIERHVHNGNDYFIYKVQLGPLVPGDRESVFMVQLESAEDLNGIESVEMNFGFYSVNNPQTVNIPGTGVPGTGLFVPNTDLEAEITRIVAVNEANDPNILRVDPDVVQLESTLEDPCESEEDVEYIPENASYQFDFELDIYNEGDDAVPSILVAVDLDNSLTGGPVNLDGIDVNLRSCIEIVSLSQGQLNTIDGKIGAELIPDGITLNNFPDAAWLIRPIPQSRDNPNCNLFGVLSGFGNKLTMNFSVANINLAGQGFTPGDELFSRSLVLFLGERNILSNSVGAGDLVVDATVTDPAIITMEGIECEDEDPEPGEEEVEVTVVVETECCEKPQQKNWGIKAGLDFGIPFQDNNDLAGGNFFGFTYSNYFQSFGSDKPGQLNGWYGLEMLIHQMKVADGSQAILQLDFPFSLGYSVVRKDLLNIAGSVGFTPNILLNKQELDANTLFINNYIGWTVFSNLNATTAFGTDTPFSLGARLNYVYKKLAAEYPSLYTQISLNIGFGG